MKNWCSTIILSLSLFIGACSVQSPGNDVHVKLDFEVATDSSFYPIPIVQIENRSPKRIYVYLMNWRYEVKTDSLTGSELLDFTTADIKHQDFLVFDPPRPLFMQINPESAIKLHFEHIPGPHLENFLASLQEKGVYAQIGYLGSEEEFAGHLSHSAIRQILKHQKKVISPRVFKDLK